MTEFYKRLDSCISNSIPFILSLAGELSKIPSATGKECVKAGFIRNTLNNLVGDGAWIDEADNVIYQYKGAYSERICVYSAHIDTVFHDINDIKPETRGRRIYAPSIWDNSINIAALIYSIKILKELEIPLETNILFAFDTGEEGYGNLKGIQSIIKDRENIIDEVIAVDLGYDTVVDSAVGSRRYSVMVQTTGGHSWTDFGTPNAISEAAGIIKELYGIKTPDSYKTTYNVGVIKGGTSVNTIASCCEFDIDLRSEDNKCLEKLDSDFKEVLKHVKNTNIEIFCRLLGERPCGKLDSKSSLFNRIKSVRSELGLDLNFRSGSTDANLPLSIGIPAVSFGACNGGGAHTSGEYIEIDSLETGMKHLLYFMLK